MQVLLTGADGFTGIYVQRALEAAGHTSVAFTADLRDGGAVKAALQGLQFDAVLHLAAQAFVAHNDANEFYDVNLKGTNTLLDVLSERADTLQAVILASTAAVYGNRREGVLSEDMVPDPVGHYAVSKLAMEHASRVFSALPISIVRPFNYTGVGQSPKFVIPKIVSHFAEKKPRLELGNTDVYREFGDVRAVAEIYVRLLEARPSGVVVNLCTGTPYALRDVIDMCEQISGHTLEIDVNPAFVRAQEVKSLTGDPSRLTSVIGALPDYTLRDTLTWMLD